MVDSDYKAYHESISTELLASRNRVRYFIGSSNWPEDGRFKEMLLMNYLKKNLPSNVSVGTGFVKNGEETTKQIDLIVYDNSIPTLFSEGDFVIVLPESVYGIIEVKFSTITPTIITNSSLFTVEYSLFANFSTLLPNDWTYTANTTVYVRAISTVCPPEIKMLFGDISLYMCDFPVPLGPNSHKL